MTPKNAASLRGCNRGNEMVCSAAQLQQLGTGIGHRSRLVEMHVLKEEDLIGAQNQRFAMEGRYRHSLGFRKLGGKLLAAQARLHFALLELSFIEVCGDGAHHNAGRGEQAAACFAGGSQNNFAA